MIMRSYAFLSDVKKASFVPVNKQHKNLWVCQQEYKVLWHVEALLDNDSVNKGRCYVMAAIVS
jgi:hypothetical protein